MKKIILLLAVLILITLPLSSPVKSKSDLTDWYITDFLSTITVQTDSSLLIEEKIIADAGNLPDKHGIFRVLPTETKTENGAIKTPVELIGITDFDGKRIPHSASADNFNHTITWKIGDPDKTVTGENRYKIVYAVKNAVRSNNNDFDELYWNLSGNFWDIEIDKFHAKIIFPEPIGQNNAKASLYSGNLNQNGNDLAISEWNGNIFEVDSIKTLAPNQGITASITFPKGIISPYQPGFLELYGDYLWFLVPFFVLAISWRVWLKYGKDPVVNKTIIPEFEIPENLTPMEMGILFKNGSFGNSLISATIIDLAVKKYIVIEEIPKNGIFGAQDFRLKRIWGSGYPALNNTEELLLKKIFGSGQEILLSKLKDKFYNELPEIKKTAIGAIKQKGLIYQSGLTLKTVFLAFAVIAAIAGVIAIANGVAALASAAGLAAAILFVFALLMPKRTPKGAELNWRVKGFKLYMETAEKYRSRFNEKENIFEKFLPYAMVFGIAKLWAKKMEEIYGKEYFANYHPAWYAGAIAGGFNADSFTSQMTAVSAGIAANIGTTSGAGGSGSSGGGGGGGGGGGW